MEAMAQCSFPCILKYSPWEEIYLSLLACRLSWEDIGDTIYFDEIQGCVYKEISACCFLFVSFSS